MTSTHTFRTVARAKLLISAPLSLTYLLFFSSSSVCKRWERNKNVLYYFLVKWVEIQGGLQQLFCPEALLIASLVHFPPFWVVFLSLSFRWYSHELLSNIKETILTSSLLISRSIVDFLSHYFTRKWPQWDQRFFCLLAFSSFRSNIIQSWTAITMINNASRKEQILSR